MSNGFDPDQDQYYVDPDRGPNCLQTLSADCKNYQLKYMNQYPDPRLYNFFMLNSTENEISKAHIT